MENEISQLLLRAIFCVAAISLRIGRWGRKIATMAIDSHPA
jgi:hypothetical protein